MAHCCTLFSYTYIYTEWCSYLIFLECDLPHLSVPYKGACHLKNSFWCTHFNEVVGREVARLISHLSLKTERTCFESIRSTNFGKQQAHRGTEMDSFHCKLKQQRFRLITELNSLSTTPRLSHPGLWSDHQGCNTQTHTVHNQCSALVHFNSFHCNEKYWIEWKVEITGSRGRPSQWPWSGRERGSSGTGRMCPLSVDETTQWRLILILYWAVQSIKGHLSLCVESWD